MHLQSDGPNLFYGSKDSFVSSSVCSKGWTKATKVIYWTPGYVQSGSSSFLSFSSVKQNLILREKVDGAWIGSFAASFFSPPPSFANCFQSHFKIALYLIGGLLWNLPADNRASGKDLELVQCMQFRAPLLRRKLRCTMPSPTSLVDWFHGPVA